VLKNSPGRRRSTFCRRLRGISFQRGRFSESRCSRIRDLQLGVAFEFGGRSDGSAGTNFSHNRSSPDDQAIQANVRLVRLRRTRRSVERLRPRQPSGFASSRGALSKASNLE
jgi:hypothetical protein